MRQLKAFVKKEFLHVFRDTRTMLILFGMPVAQIILFGFAISTEVRNIDLAVVVPQSSVCSASPSRRRCAISTWPWWCLSQVRSRAG